jgi:hypothetical protein
MPGGVEGWRRETPPYPDQSANEIARFGVLKLPIPTTSNHSASEKQTPAQALTGLFTVDCVNESYRCSKVPSSLDSCFDRQITPEKSASASSRPY